MNLPDHIRNVVGDLPPFDSVTSAVLKSSCILSAFYVSTYVQGLSGPETNTADITVAGLAYLWILLHKVAGDKVDSSPQRDKRALQWIKETLSDNEVKNLGTLVHGRSDVLALAAQPPPLQVEESSSGSSSEDSAQPASSAPIRQYSIVRGAPSIGRGYRN